MIAFNFLNIIPDVISGVLIASILGVITWIIRKMKSNLPTNKQFNNSILQDSKKLELLIQEGRDCLQGTEVRYKREFVRSYYSIFKKWPEDLSSSHKNLLSNFITPNKNTHYYNGLDYSIKIMITTLNGYRPTLFI